jgi:phage shock protein E
MDWVPYLLTAAALAAFATYRRAGQIPTRKAVEFLKQGALVIDVRTPAEFRSGHLPCAINIPHDEVQFQIARHAPDKERVLLLHCQSGMRSALAKKKLTALGYRNTFDLGSYFRAMRIAG